MNWKDEPKLHSLFLSQQKPVNNIEMIYSDESGSHILLLNRDDFLSVSKIFTLNQIPFSVRYL